MMLKDVKTTTIRKNNYTLTLMHHTGDKVASLYIEGFGVGTLHGVRLKYVFPYQLRSFPNSNSFLRATMAELLEEDFNYAHNILSKIRKAKKAKYK